MQFSTCITLVAHVLACAHAIAHIKWRRFRLVYCYFKNKKQRAKINSAYIALEKKLYTTHGSILGPLLINIFLSDLLYVMSDTDFAITSYAAELLWLEMALFSRKALHNIEKHS